MNFFITAFITGLCYSLMGLGIFISMKIFRIPDITTDGSFTLGAALTAILLSQSSLHPLLLLIIVLAAGALAGALTAIIHHFIKIDALLAGILVMTALYSINLAVMGRSNIPLLDTQNVFHYFDAGSGVNQWVVPLILVLMLVLILYMLFKTDFGISMRAAGDNEAMSASAGISIGKMKITGLAMANALTAGAGFLITQYQNFADINMGIGIVIVGLGSVLIGDSMAQLLRVHSLAGRMLCVVIGCILFQMILAMSLSLGIHPNLLKLVTAVLVLLSVSLPMVRRQNKSIIR